MESDICTHLAGYGTQYAAAVAAYEAFLAAVDSMVVDGPEGGRGEAVGRALAAWQGEDGKLRQMLVDLVAEGKVYVPRGLMHAAVERQRRVLLDKAPLVCAECRRRVPRLAYPEWRFAHNGVVTFRGRELAPVAV